MASNTQQAETTDPYLSAFNGAFVNVIRWEQLDKLWETLKDNADNGWYIYPIGETPPSQPVDTAKFLTFIDEVDALLRREHEERYCGIVYSDSMQEPGFIKIYDPNNLGHVCGSDGSPPPLPGWVLSRIPPADLEAAMPPPNNRRRWWQKLFH